MVSGPLARTSYPRCSSCVIVLCITDTSVRWFVSKAMIRGKAPACLSQYCMRPCSTWQSAPSQS
eukprot:922802-Alexandrium_andersonii.AAC.1